MSKKLDKKKITNELKEASAFFQKPVQLADLPAADPHSELSNQTGDRTIDQPTNQAVEKSTSESTKQSTTPTLDPTLESTQIRGTSRGTPRANLRDISRTLPTRDEIQGFSFQLRDELKVKVQAEVPHFWQKELEDIARELDVKKLELYRYILGEFLGKVRRKKDPK